MEGTRPGTLWLVKKIAKISVLFVSIHPALNMWIGIILLWLRTEARKYLMDLTFTSWSVVWRTLSEMKPKGSATTCEQEEEKEEGPAMTHHSRDRCNLKIIMRINVYNAIFWIQLSVCLKAAIRHPYVHTHIGDVFGTYISGPKRLTIVWMKRLCLHRKIMSVPPPPAHL